MNGSLQQIPRRDPPNENGHGTTHWVELLRTLADPIRLRIIRLLEQQAHVGLSVGELANVLKLPQSTVSRHLKTLTETNLAAVKRDGTSMRYRLSASAAENSIRHLRTLSRQHLDSDPLAKTDAQRLTHILRQRESAADKFFGKNAPKWDQIRNQLFGGFGNTFHLQALLNPEWVVGDLGTGTGILLPQLAPYVQRIFAVDSSAAMLKSARARVKALNLSNVEVREGSLEQLPLPPQTLDVALVVLVLHFVTDPQAALKEISRVLKPRGILLIEDLQPHGVDFFQEKMAHRWMGFEQTQMEGWLANAGFTRPRFHSLPAEEARSKKSGLTVPDLFVLRAEAG